MLLFSYRPSQKRQLSYKIKGKLVERLGRKATDLMFYLNDDRRVAEMEELPCMINDKEQFIFKRELGRLQDDYKRCPSPEVKNQLKQDIELLKKAIRLLSS